ncbi:MAG: hypothetical protein KatS3mg076_0865 [Candidatus Binatia bacterium]|nr:MAG: hypothetical protein KatS3mg076_0865 [Candidatus Binatia bacterium]
MESGRRVFLSTSARERLEAAAAFLRECSPAEEVFVLAPAREAADDFVRSFAAKHGAVFSVHRTTVLQLAARLAAHEFAEEALAPIGSVGLAAVAARAAFEARKSRGLAYFEPVVDLPGFPRALARTLEELRLAGIARSPGKHDRPPLRDLLRLLGTYERCLRDGRLADRAELFVSASHALDRPEFDGVARAAKLFLDVPIRSAREAEFVERLCERASRAFFALAEADTATLARLAPAWPPPERTTIPPRSSLDRLRVFLFSASSPPEAEPDETVSFFSAPGEGRECTEIARRILEETRRGVPLDRMAVLLRSPATYVPLLSTALARAGIPAYFARGTTRPDPAGRAFLAFLSFVTENFSAARFAEYLSFAQVPSDIPDAADLWQPPRDEELSPSAAVSPPAALREEGTTDREEGVSWWRWEQFVTEAAVVAGTRRWRERLDGLAAEIEKKKTELEKEEADSPRRSSLARRAKSLGRLRRFLFPLLDELEKLPPAASWGFWIEFLSGLAPRVLRSPERILATLADLRPMAEVGPVTLDEVASVLAPFLRSIGEEPPATRYGRVFVAPIEEARARSFTVVFVPGLAERMFPERPREDPLLLDGYRKGLSRDLRVQDDRAHEERLRLRLAVGAAEERVVLSYPRTDVVEARPRVTSFYGLDVVRAATGRVPEPHTLEKEAASRGETRLGWPAPKDPEKAIDALEHDLAVLAVLLRSRDVKKTRGRARYLFELNEHLGRSLRARWKRWSERWRQQDGLWVREGPAAEALATHRPSRRPYSVSALQRFSVCPYQFYLGAILGLEPREEPEPLEWLDPLTRGRLFHDVQARTLEELRRGKLLPLRPDRLRRAEELLLRVFEQRSKEYREELVPRISRVWEDEMDLLRGELRLWLRHLAESGAEWVPRYFELGFGLSRLDGRDRGSISDPVVIGRRFRLRGSVDLVEEHLEKGYLRVTDHKTGKNRLANGVVVGGGEILQPVLYGLAVEALTGKKVRAGRLFFCTTAGGFSEVVVPLDEDARRTGLRVLRTVEDVLEKGQLFPYPREGACDFCEFRPVCGPYEEIRSRKKAPVETTKLVDAVRALP